MVANDQSGGNLAMINHRYQRFNWSEKEDIKRARHQRPTPYLAARIHREARRPLFDALTLLEATLWGLNTVALAWVIALAAHI